MGLRRGVYRAQTVRLPRQATHFLPLTGTFHTCVASCPPLWAAMSRTQVTDTVALPRPITNLHLRYLSSIFYQGTASVGAQALQRWSQSVTRKVRKEEGQNPFSNTVKVHTSPNTMSTRRLVQSRGFCLRSETPFAKRCKSSRYKPRAPKGHSPGRHLSTTTMNKVTHPH